MPIEPQGIKDVDGKHRRQLGTSRLRRKSTGCHSVRTTSADMLVALPAAWYMK